MIYVYILIEGRFDEMTERLKRQKYPAQPIKEAIEN